MSAAVSIRLWMRRTKSSILVHVQRRSKPAAAVLPPPLTPSLRIRALSTASDAPQQQPPTPPSSLLWSTDDSLLRSHHHHHQQQQQQQNARTPEQERAAQLEQEQMERATRRLLQALMDDNDRRSEQQPSCLTPATIQELRVAFQYWARRRRPTTTTTITQQKLGDDDDSSSSSASSIAEDLLRFIILQQQHDDNKEALQTILKTDDSSCGGLIHLMEQYLMPFRGTSQSYSLVVAKHSSSSSRRLRFQPNVHELKEALRRASDVLRHMRRLQDDPSYVGIVPDRYSCNMVLNVWAKRCWFLNEFPNEANKDDFFVETALGGATSPRECIDRIQEFLELMREDPNYPTPEDDAHMLLLTAWVHSGLPQRADEAEKLLDAMKRKNLLGTIPFSAVLYAHATLAEKDPNHVVRAAALLDRMKMMQQNNNNEAAGPAPDVVCYATVLLAYANAGQVEKAQMLLSQMEECQDVVRPNAICYNTVLDAWAKSNNPRAAQKAEELLERMQHLHYHDVGSNPDGRPDLVSYASVISAWARSPDPAGAERAEQLLLHCMNLSETNPAITPDLITFNIVLDAYSRRSGDGKSGGHRDISAVDNSEEVEESSAVRRAERLLQRMQDGVFRDIRPDIISYNCILNAWAKDPSFRVKAARRGREILEYLKKEYHAGNALLKPDSICYNVVIGMVARSGEKGRIQEAEELMEEMKEFGLSPDVITYNTLMDAIIKAGGRDCAKQAEELLKSMEYQYQNGNKNVRPNEVSFNTVIHAYAKSGDPDAALRAESILERMMHLSSEPDRSDTSPSMISFSTVIDAYANSGQADAAEALLQRMDGTANVQASTITYNTVINALAKSRQRDAPQKAEALLNRMQAEYESGNHHMRPNTTTFSSLINCWAQSGQPGAAEKAQAILERMEELNDRGVTHIRPNEFSYSTVLKAWSRSGNPDSGERALHLLDRMEDACANGTSHCRPNSYCYNATIDAIAKSSSTSKALQAYDTLRRMMRAYEDGSNSEARPSPVSFSSVLNACAYTTLGSPQQRAEAFRIARITLKELLESSDFGAPNTVTFVNFMTACARLLPKGEVRDTLMSSTFRECHLRGHVNGKVVSILRSAVSPRTYRQQMAWARSMGSGSSTSKGNDEAVMKRRESVE